MSLIHRLLSAGPAWSTHHRIALSALQLLRCDDGWARMFRRQSERLFAGTAVPEDDFGDFKNHVMYVRDGHWGGAAAAARAWYLRTMYALRDQLWPEAAYSAGVLCHYVVDPLMPLHTAQNEAAAALHYGIDLAIESSFARLQNQLLTKLGGYPPIEVPTSKDWLERLLRSGAEQAHSQFDLLLDHCEPNLLLRRPSEGMDDDAASAVAKMIGVATSTYARILERAIEESGAAVPKVRLFGYGLTLLMRAPTAWLTGPLARMNKRAALHKMVREYQQTGKVVKNLCPADKEVRQQYALEVRRITLEQLDGEAIRPVGTKNSRILAANSLAANVASEAVTIAAMAPVRAEKVAVRAEKAAPVEMPRVEKEKVERPPAAPPLRMEPIEIPAMPKAPAPMPAAPKPPVKPASPEPPAAPVRFSVGMSSEVGQAPGITPQVAEQLIDLGIENVGDLLTADPKVIVDQLKSPSVTADRVIDWQAAAALACQLPEIRGNDLLLLVAAGVHDPRQLSRFAPKELLDRLQPILKSADSPDMIRLDPLPALRDVSNWIDLAKKARPLSAAV
jgi:hypothetical protein